MKNRVSVIIPTYNMGPTIERALDSVFAQTYRNLEVIIVDDGSTDNTKSIVTNYVEMHTKSQIPIRYFYQDNKGKSTAVNRGISHSESDYIVLLDSDDELTKGSIELRLSYLEANTDKYAVFALANWTKAGKVYSTRRPNIPIDQQDLARKICRSIRAPTHLMTFMYRRELFDKVGLFDETNIRAEDQDFAVRVLLNVPVGFIDFEVYNYHVDTHNLSLRIKNRLRGLVDKKKVIDQHEKGIARMLVLAAYYPLQIGKLIYDIFFYKK